MKKFGFLGLLSVSAIALALSAGAHAGNENGNGGTCIKVASKCLLLDLVEAGVENQPYFVDRKVFSQTVRDRLFNALSLSSVDRGAEVADLLAAKLYEIDGYAPFWGFLMKKMFLELNWSYVNLELVALKDHSGTPIKLRANSHQMAIRRGYYVSINRALWEAADVEHRVGLLIHEVNYALSPVERQSVLVEGTSVEIRSQFGDRSRRITGLMFREGSLAKWKGPLSADFVNELINVGYGGENMPYAHGAWRKQVISNRTFIAMPRESHNPNEYWGYSYGLDTGEVDYVHLADDGKAAVRAEKTPVFVTWNFGLYLDRDGHKITPYDENWMP